MSPLQWIVAWLLCGGVAELLEELVGGMMWPRTADDDERDAGTYVVKVIAGIVFGPLQLASVLRLLGAPIVGWLWHNAKNAWWRRRAAQMEREHVAAVRRFEGCTHARTMGGVDVGVPGAPQLVRKCLDCWALELTAFAPGAPGWHPNVVPPKVERRRLRAAKATRRDSA